MRTRELFSLTIEKDGEKSRVRITGTVPKEKIKEARAETLKKIGEKKKIDGFREGAAPPEVVERSVGALEVWQSAAQEVIAGNFAEMMAEEGLAPLGSPNMKFTAVPVGGDVSFEVEFFIMPDIDMPDYKAIVEGMEAFGEPEPATDEEVRRIVTDIRRNIYKKENPEKDLPKEEDLPELTDEQAREITGRNEDAKSFVKGVRESITEEKKARARAECRQKILDAIREKTKIALPEIIVDEESKRAYNDLKARAEHLGTTIEEYLKNEGMTEEQLWERLKKEAEERSKVQLIMNTISAKENIHADREAVEKEVKRLKERGNGGNDEQIYMYIESLLTNEAVMRFLEARVGGQQKQQKSG